MKLIHENAKYRATGLRKQILQQEKKKKKKPTQLKISTKPSCTQQEKASLGHLHSFLITDLAL